MNHYIVGIDIKNKPDDKIYNSSESKEVSKLINEELVGDPEKVCSSVETFNKKKHNEKIEQDFIMMRNDII